MPCLPNPRWEAAAQFRASGRDIIDAYRQAGFAGKYPTATRFFQTPDIATRVAEIQSERYESERKARDIATKKAGLDEAWIIERLKYGIEIALRGEPILDENGQPTGKHGKRDLNAFSRMIAHALDIKGMRIQKVEMGGPGEFSRLTDEELDEEIKKIARDLDLPEDALERLLSKPQGHA
jgi:hypothetical protein